MSRAALREVKEAVDAEEYENALEKCDDLVKGDNLEPQERFIVLSTKGHVCIQLAKVDLGEKALLEASKLITKDIPQPQVQKLYKMLGDLYEKIGKWDSYASATSKLYDMVIEKGNFERAEVLSLSIAEAYSKCTSLHTLEEACKYIHTSLRNQNAKKSPENTIALVASYGIILDTVQNEKAKAAARSISDKKQDATEEDWRSPDPAIECLYRVITQTCASILPEQEQRKGLYSIVNRYLRKGRNAVLASEISWKDMIESCKKVKAIINSSEELLVLYLECYAFGGSDAKSQDDLLQMADNIINSNPSNTTANIIKAFHLLKNGLYLDALPYIEICMEHWKAHSVKPASKSVKKSSSSALISSEDIVVSLSLTMVVLANAFTEFHFSMVFDSLHFVEEAGRRCEYLDSNFDFFGGKLRYTIEVCKMITYCTVKQRSLARTRLIQLLKSIRSKGNDKVTPIHLQLDEGVALNHILH